MKDLTGVFIRENAIPVATAIVPRSGALWIANTAGFFKPQSSILKAAQIALSACFVCAGMTCSSSITGSAEAQRTIFARTARIFLRLCAAEGVGAMREKECYREILARLDERFPGKEFLNQKETAEFCGCCARTINRNYAKFFKPGVGISKVQLARVLA